MNIQDSTEKLLKDAAGIANDAEAESWNPPTGTFADFNGTPPPRPWLVHGFIPYAYQPIMLAGAPGSSKSLLGAQLCREVSLGRDFLNLPTMQTKSLYVTFEDSTEDLHIRAAHNSSRVNPEGDKSREAYWMYLGKEDFSFCFKNPRTGRLEAGPGYSRLLKWVLERDIHFIVGDHLNKFFPDNENDRGLVNAFGAILTRFCEAARCQWLMLAHTNKTGREYSGSSANAGVYRQVMLLTQSAGAYTLECCKSNYTKAGKKLYYVFDDWYCKPLSADDMAARQAAHREGLKEAAGAQANPIIKAVVSVMEPGKSYAAEDLRSLAGLHSSPAALGRIIAKTDLIQKERPAGGG